MYAGRLMVSPGQRSWVPKRLPSGQGAQLRPPPVRHKHVVWT